MNPKFYTSFEEVGMADVLIPLQPGLYTKYADKEEKMKYTNAMITSILGTSEWDWAIVASTECEIAFFGREDSGLPKNAEGMAYCEMDIPMYGPVFIVNNNHVSVEEILKCGSSLLLREGFINSDANVVIKTDGSVKEAKLGEEKFVPLETLQAIVGGLIECVYLNDKRALVINEEGKLLSHENDQFGFNLIASMIAQQIILGPALLVDSNRI